MDVALDAVNAARSVDLSRLANRVAKDTHFVQVWPGEHYKLLAGLVAALRPRRVVEIGTYTGLSALAMRERLDPVAQMVTFDVVPWREIQGTALTDSDFGDANFAQVVDDITYQAGFASHHDLIEDADLIFLDAAKDGKMEARFLTLLASAQMHHRAILVMDDIRLQNMLVAWRDISLPKLDVTSFGHWSGTGMVELGDFADTTGVSP